MSKIYKVKLIEKIDEGNNILSLYYDVDSEFEWDVASHVSLALEGYETDGKVDKNLVRKFSITTLPEENKIGFTTRLDSSDSMYKKILKDIKINDCSYIMEVSSHLPIRRDGKEIVFISMGVGMATMRPIIKSIKNDFSGVESITNIIVSKTDTVLYDEEGLYDGIENIICRGRNDFSNVIEKMNCANKVFYIVGSNDFVKTTVSRLRRKGVEVENINIDKDRKSLELMYAQAGFIPVEEREKSSNFKKIALPVNALSLGCACGGNCTCGRL